LLIATPCTAAGAPLGAVFGNLLGGFIASYANWKWVFGACAGVAIAVTAAGVFFIPPPPPSEVAIRKQNVSLARSVDWLGGFLITAGLLALLFALTEGNVVGWHTVWIYMLMVIALLLIGMFATWQWYQEKHTTRPPLMKVSVFRSGIFSMAMLLMALFFATFNDWIIFVTFFFQDYQGLSPLQTTLRFIATGVFGVVVAFVVSLLSSKVPTYILLIIGNVTMGLACLLFAVPIPSNTSYFAFGLPAMLLAVTGADITWPCLTLFTSKSLPPEDQALGGALINASGQIGRSIGLAITTALQTSIMARERGVPVEHAGKVLPWDGPSLTGLRVGNWFNVAIAFFCVILVGFTFRGTGIVGKIEKSPERTRAGEAVADEENTRRG
jgi:predicted MFS family arabinose efflux permease